MYNSYAAAEETVEMPIWNRQCMTIKVLPICLAYAIQSTLSALFQVFKHLKVSFCVSK